MILSTTRFIPQVRVIAKRGFHCTSTVFQQFNYHVESYNIPSNLECNIEEFDNNGSVEDFWSRYVSSNKPAVIRGYKELEDWSLFKIESFTDIADILQDAILDIKVDFGPQINKNWKAEDISFKEYTRLLDDPDESEKQGYFAQAQLFNHYPQLFDTISIPKLIRQEERKGTLEQINTWIGPKNTITPLHYHPISNFFIQMKGSKYIRLYSDNLDVSDVPLLENESLIPFSLKYLQGPCYETILHKGDLLFIPEFYWHYVQSISPSFSINFYWYANSITKGKF